MVKTGSYYIEDYAFYNDGYIKRLSFTKNMENAKVIDLDVAYHIVNSHSMRTKDKEARLIDADDFAKRLKNARYRKTLLKNKTVA